MTPFNKIMAFVFAFISGAGFAITLSDLAYGHSFNPILLVSAGMMALCSIGRFFA